MKTTVIALLIASLTGLCQAQNYKKRADDYYKYYNYEKALKDYGRLWRKDKDNIELLEKIITCYIKDNTLKDEALPYIERLLELKPNNLEAKYNKTLVLFHSHKFDEAYSILQEIEPLASNTIDLLKQITTLKSYINNAKLLIAQPLDVEFINLGNEINTPRNEVSPFISADEQSLFYSSDKRYNSYAGIYYYNICVAEKQALNFEKGKTIGSQLNSIFDEMVAGISPDGSQLFAFHNRDGDETMGYSSYLGNHRFEPLANFGPPLDAKGSEYGMWMTAGKDTILFASENQQGNTDIYYAIKLPTGEWGEARELPGQVNSSTHNENFPVLAHNGQRLYFSSDNLRSMGGYDLFYSDWDPNKREWETPINMGYPINDTYHNYNISWVEDERFAYVSAIRPEGAGKYDIYKVVFNQTLPYTAVIKANIRIRKDRKVQIPDFSPHISVTDTLDNLIGTYKPTKDSADFILALTAGTYKIHVTHEQITPLEYLLIIPDNRYVSVADRLQLIVVPKPADIAVK
ncbi:PD40 domain-containing protein [Carboxylicivirga sediminis]|uniref:PD40 domain-containing protein n=1 Tax=Carboxylicivirga sediminis TaxID=2006564 RepID=A0A941F2Z8_9BACT|nr:PD40 domain-containing protein [Carboxylicivirga sediminis]MBR8535359.1 PD40 domain-containing protein [Carboxylicivirga sediminis]